MQATTETRTFTAAVPILGGMLVKKSTTANRVTPFAVGDSIALLFGVALNDAFTGFGVEVCSILGAAVSLLSDGTTTIAEGDAIAPSSTLDGYVMGSTSNVAGHSIAAVPATLQSPVRGVLQGAGAGGASGEAVTFTSPATVNTTAKIITTPASWATGKLLSLKNNGTELLFVDSAGQINSANGTNLNLLGSANVQLCPAGSAKMVVDSSSARPATAYGITFGDANYPISTVNTRHVAGLSAAVPGIAAGAGAGTSPSLTVVAGSSDVSGTLNIVTGSAPSAANSILATLTFNAVFANKTPKVTISAANAAAAALLGTGQVFVDQSSGTTSVFVIRVGTVALGASQTYIWNYVAIE